MLRQRIVTALVLGLLVVGAILLLPSEWFGVMMLVGLGIGGWEWARLIGLERTQYRWALVSAVVSLSLLSGALLEYRVFLVLIFTGSLAFWIFVVARLLRFAGDPGCRDGVAVGTVSAIMALVPTWVALVTLHRDASAGPGYVMMLMALVWAADTGAYFAGKRWGRRKLAPTISPGKTIEGVYGALAAAVATGFATTALLGVPSQLIIPYVVLSVLTVGFAVLGDLFESMIKRQRSIKDSGTLLPGHGGMLDRIDSLLAAAPLFALGVIGLSG